MPRVQKSALVPYSAPVMFDLVIDVESYPEFLPWCRQGRLLSQDEFELCGEIEVARAGIHQTFSTCNQLFPHERIDLRLREGPFKRLEGSWEFQALRDDACKVTLLLEFEFSGRLINAAFGRVFAHIADTLVDAFCKRAKDLNSE